MQLLVVLMNIFMVLMVPFMIGVPSMPIRRKRSERLQAQIVGWNTALVFVGALILAVLR